MKYVKKLMILALALVLGFMAVTTLGGKTANAETEETMEKGVHFTSGASGRVFVEPDIAYLTVGPSSENEVAADAMAEVNTLMEAILTAVKEAGIAEDDIKTSTISIDVNYDYSGPKRVLIGYLARNTIAVTIRDLANVAPVLDAVIAAGANDVGSLVFDKEDKADAYDEALTIAVKRATDKVNVLHAASGVGGTLKPVRFEEFSAQVYPQAAKMDMAEEAIDGAIVLPGAIEVTAQVSVEFVAE